MPTYLITIQTARPDGHGVRLSPGIRMSQAADRPGIRRMIQGAGLELRLPGGARHRTTLVTYGVEVERGPDGAIYLRGDPSDAEIKLTVAGDVPPEACAAGTEVWLIAD